MNRITLYGRVCEGAKLLDVDAGDRKIPMASFSVSDYGLPGQKGDPMVLEVHFMKDIAKSIFQDLVSGKEVIVDGFLTEKRYVTRNGDERKKKYISASVVEFVGKGMEEDIEVLEAA